jgi:hypothetical protein
MRETLRAAAVCALDHSAAVRCGHGMVYIRSVAKEQPVLQKTEPLACLTLLALQSRRVKLTGPCRNFLDSRRWLRPGI